MPTRKTSRQPRGGPSRGIPRVAARPPALSRGSASQQRRVWLHYADSDSRRKASATPLMDRGLRGKRCMPGNATGLADPAGSAPRSMDDPVTKFGCPERWPPFTVGLVHSGYSSLDTARLLSVSSDVRGKGFVMPSNELTIGLVAILTLVILVGAAVFLRGRAGGEFSLGPIWARVTGGRGPKATIADAKSKQGGANARSSGDAEIRRTNVAGDLTAEAGLPSDPPTQDPKA